MGTILFIIITIVVLSIIPMPKRDLSKKSRRRSSRSNNAGLPWLNQEKKSKKSKDKYFRKFDSF